MKKPKAVMDAETAMQAKGAEVIAAKEALKRLETELQDARAAVRQAKANADASLPRCRLVVVRWRSGAEMSNVEAVIVRRTPTGTLVVRRVGDPPNIEYKFKWTTHSAKFRQAEKSDYISDTRELRDVPADYLPNLEPTQ